MWSIDLVHELGFNGLLGIALKLVSGLCIPSRKGYEVTDSQKPTQRDRISQ